MLRREPVQLAVAWHGAAWRDDRPVGPPSHEPLPPPPAADTDLTARTEPEELFRGSRRRKSSVRKAVGKVLFNSAEPLSTYEIYARVKLSGVKHTIAGVNTALFSLRHAGLIEVADRSAVSEAFGRFRTVYRWAGKRQVVTARPRDRFIPKPAKASLPDKAAIGRLGGQKSAETRPRC